MSYEGLGLAAALLWLPFVALILGVALARLRPTRPAAAVVPARSGLRRRFAITGRNSGVAGARKVSA